MIMTPQIQPISDLARDHKTLLRKLKDGPVFLSQRGRPAAVVVSPAEWDKFAARLESLQDEIDVLEAKLALLQGESIEDADMDELRAWAGKDAVQN